MMLQIFLCWISWDVFVIYHHYHDAKIKAKLELADKELQKFICTGVGVLNELRAN